MKKLFFLLLGAIAFPFAVIFSQTFPAGFQMTDIGTGWVQPAGAQFSPDGQKLFVWEKGGKVFVCNRDVNGVYVKQTTPVLDISDEVGNWRDHGLLGFALDPSFSTNGYFYLLYVVDRYYLFNFGKLGYNPATNEYYKATIGRVTRFQATMNGTNLVSDPANRLILIGETPSTGIPQLYESHGVGALAFADDGTLIVSTGDGASYSSNDGGSASETYYLQALADGIIRSEENVGAFRSQMLNSLNGKILRINPANGDGLPSNPFYDASAPRSAKSRVYAFGFRNPYRFSIKPGTGSTNPAAGDIGEIFIGDVGYNTWEEMDIIKEPGVNCGWPLFEGLTPVLGYFNLHTVNKDEPNPLYDGTTCKQQYFKFEDLIKQATADQIKTVFNPCDNTQPIGTGNRYYHLRPSLDWRHGADVARVGIFNGNDAAVATIGTPESGVTGTPFRGNCAVGGFWYTGTQFPAKYRYTFFMADYGGKWIKSIGVKFTDDVESVKDFGSGFVAIACLIQNPLDGSMVFVDIGKGLVRTVSYGGNQLPVPVLKSDKIYGPSVLNVTFKGSDSYDPDGTISSYLWNFGDGGTSTDADPAHNFSVPSGTPAKFIVKLTVTDNSGASVTDSMIISVNNTPPVVHITSPVNNSKYVLGTDTLYSCTADVSDAEQGPDQLTYAWQTFLVHNNHTHPGPIDNNKNTATMISRIGCNGDSYSWRVVLTVTDAAGLSASDTTQIFPDCSSESPLPVFMSSFTVEQQGNANLVKWVTGQEQDVSYFEVERSADGVNFIAIDRQKAKNLITGGSYSYSDDRFNPGVNYYRIKAVDLDGKVSYSFVIKVGDDRVTTGLRVVPNPARDNFAVRFHAMDNGTVTILVSDVNGKLLRRQVQTAGKGENLIYINGFEKEASGTYFISLRQGDRILHTKFIKD